MKRLLYLFSLILIANAASGQTLCTKFTVVKEIVKTEKKRVLVQAAVFENQWTPICTKQGYWGAVYKDGLPCKQWFPPEYTQVLEQVETKAAVYKDIEVQKTERNADVTAYVTDCN